MTSKSLKLIRSISELQKLRISLIENSLIDMKSGAERLPDHTFYRGQFPSTFSEAIFLIANHEERSLSEKLVVFDLGKWYGTKICANSWRI